MQCSVKDCPTEPLVMLHEKPYCGNHYKEELDRQHPDGAGLKETDTYHIGGPYDPHGKRG